jgi:CRP-like cAMP-binding protein
MLIKLTQSDLAALVGASRVRVIFALGYFRKRGAIRVGGDGRTIILHAETLARRAQ